MTGRVFFIKSVILGIILFSIVFFTMQLNLYIINKSVFKLKPNINKVFLGSSTTECAINDTIIKNSINISSSADSYLYSYLKLKHIIKNNKIDTVFLDFCPGSFSIKIERRWTVNSSHLNSRIGNYWFLLDKNTIGFFEKTFNAEFYKAFIKYSIVESFQNIEYLLKTKPLSTKFGMHKELFDNKLDESIEATMKIDSSDTVYLNSLIEIENLQNIVKLCLKEQIHLILISTPWHKAYSHHMRNTYENFINYYKKNQFDIEYYNFYNLEMTNNNFADVGPLNYIGSNSLSIYINDILNNKCKPNKIEGNQKIFTNLKQ